MAFMLFQADSIEDFEDSFLIASASFATVLNFGIIAFWKMTKMFQMIQSFERIIEKSKFYLEKITNFSHSLIKPTNNYLYSEAELNDPGASVKYNKMNEIIERASKLYEILLVKISVFAITLPALMMTAINHFVDNLGNESYILPFPVL